LKESSQTASKILWTVSKERQWEEFFESNFILIHELCTELGYEQLAQRGCQTRSICSLGLDLTSRLVTIEELTLSLNTRFSRLNHNAPAAWWDRTCDIGLIIGTFIHGFGNYDSMLNDESLPFARKIESYVASDNLSSDAHTRFVNAASATKGVCDAALEASKLKAQKEVQKAVAAAAAASTEREKDAALLREGAADQSLISNMSEQKIDNLYEIEGGRDAHFITLPRTRSTIISALHHLSMPSVDLSPLPTGTGTKGFEELKFRRRLSARLSLTMPDARVLNFRLKLLLASIDAGYYGESDDDESLKTLIRPKYWPSSRTVEATWKMRDICPFKEETAQLAAEYAGIGMAGTQSGASHRTIDDRSDYSIAAASQDLFQVAHGPDSVRYLRALGVPMLFGKFALIALAHAEECHLATMLSNERTKYYGVASNSKILDSNREVLARSVSSIGQSGSDEDQQTAASTNIEVESEHLATTSIHSANDTFGLANVEGDPSPGRKNLMMPLPFRESAELRAGLCMIVCYYGFPSSNNDGMRVNEALWTNNSFKEDGSDDEPPRFLFQTSLFCSMLKDRCKGIEIPEWGVIVEYLENAFLPHCLKLCIYGNGSSTTDARGSKGNYETFDGSNRYIEPSEKLQSPLPDPCLPLKEHSIEAVGMACAILRRCRLMHCLTNIAGGAITCDDLKKISRSPVFRQSMDGLPVWWCPWIHDLALLVHAGTRGLFSVIEDRRRGIMMHGTPFSPQALSEHIQSTFFSERSQAISNLVVSTATVEDKVIWIKSCEDEFPSMNVVERRLAFLCALATEKLEGDKRFHNLPMYDHGGWPRN
jgi:hypothetical protein